MEALRGSARGSCVWATKHQEKGVPRVRRERRLPGHPRGRDVPWAPRLRACNCSQIQWVSMVGTGCPVCSSSRGPFGAQTSSFWLSTLPLPLCHPARRPPAAKRILGSAERRKNPPSGVGGAKHSGRRMGTRGLHPTAFGSPVGRGRPQPALPPNPAAAAPAAGRAAHGGKGQLSLGMGKSIFVRASESAPRGEGVGKTRDPKCQWGRRRTRSQTPGEQQQAGGKTRWSRRGLQPGWLHGAG